MTVFIGLSMILVIYTLFWFLGFLASRSEEKNRRAREELYKDMEEQQKITIQNKIIWEKI